MGCIEDVKLVHLRINTREFWVCLHHKTGIFREYVQSKTDVFRDR